MYIYVSACPGVFCKRPPGKQKNFMETIIFLTYKDFIKLSDFILKTFDATFIPEKIINKPINVQLTSIAEIEKHIDKYSRINLKSDTFFIISPKWSIEPVYYGYIDDTKNSSHFYYAHQRFGGPSIHFIPTYNDIKKQTKNKIIAGNLSDYSYYISGSFLEDKINGYKTIERPDTMKNALASIKKFIRQNGRKVAYRKGKIVKLGYAMNDAISHYQKGVKLLAGDLTFETE